MHGDRSAAKGPPRAKDLPPEAFVRVIKTNSGLKGIGRPDFQRPSDPVAFTLAFVSPYADFPAVMRGLQALAGATPVVGVTTAGNLCAASPTENLYLPTAENHDDVIVQLFPRSLIAAVSLHSIPLPNADIRRGVPFTPHVERVNTISASLQAVNPSFAVDVRDTVALTYIDGLSSCENYFMDAVYQSGRFPCMFIGGSAGGKLDFKHTYIFDGEHVVENHAVMAFLKLQPDRTYSVLKSQNFAMTDKYFTVIEADTDRRLVHTVLDPASGEVMPFAQALARHFNTTPAEAAACLHHHSFGIILNNGIYVRSAANINSHTGAISFFCDINPGENLYLLRASDFRANTQSDIQTFLQDKPQPLGAVLNDCVLRRLNNQDCIAEAKSDWPMPVAGFSTFGELFGINVNQTLTALVFFKQTSPAYRGRFQEIFPVKYGRFMTYFAQRIEFARANLTAVQQRLRDAAEKNSLIVDNMQDAIVTIDAAGVIQGFNKGATNIFGYTLDEVIGLKINMLMPSPYRDQHDQYMSHYKTTGEAKVIGKGREVEGLRKDGTTFPLWLNISEVKIGDDRMFVGSLRDITAEKAKEAALRQEKEAADAANQSKSEFLALMSHELRTPLNSMLGMARLLQDTSLTEEQKEFTDNVLTASNGLLEIVNDILDISKIEAGGMSLEHIGIDPCAIIDGVAKLLEPAAQAGHVRLKHVKPGEKAPYVLGDPIRFRQIVTNLVGNALKYTKDGSVDIQTAFAALPDGRVALRCSVIDAGPGIAPEKHALIFEKFTQAEDSTTRRYGGTGLGLAITKRLVEMMGGQIGVRSELGKGATFWFDIPFQVTSSLYEARHHTAALPACSGGVLPEHARVLVAEDTLMNRTLLKVVLQKLGIGHIDMVENGVEAVEACKRAQWDVVFMDCFMPEMNGYEASRAIRAMESAATRKTPIIAVTANAMKGDQEKCFAAGMDDYISKPLNFEKLHEVLGRWVRFTAPASKAAVEPALPAKQAAPAQGKTARAAKPKPRPAGGRRAG